MYFTTHDFNILRKLEFRVMFYQHTSIPTHVLVLGHQKDQNNAQSKYPVANGDMTSYQITKRRNEIKLEWPIIEALTNVPTNMTENIKKEFRAPVRYETISKNIANSEMIRRESEIKLSRQVVIPLSHACAYALYHICYRFLLLESNCRHQKITLHLMVICLEGRRRGKKFTAVEESPTFQNTQVGGFIP